MLEHAHLKSAVTEAQALLHDAMIATDPAQQALRLRDVDHSLHRLRRLVAELHGQVAKGAGDYGIDSALPTNLERTLVEVTKNFRKLVPRCTLEVAGRPRSAIADAVRIALEMGLYNALSNAYTHGHAQVVHVRLEYRLTEVVLSIRDNGRGFDVCQIRQSSHGRGIRDMARLAEAQGGTITITSDIGRGTDVTITLPLERPALGWAATPDDALSAEQTDQHEENEHVPRRIHTPLATRNRISASAAPATYPGSGRYGDRPRPRERPAHPPWVRSGGR